MMRWEIHIAGPSTMLDWLEVTFEAGDIVCTKDGDYLTLTSKVLDQLADPNCVRLRAEAIVKSTSGILRLFSAATESLAVHQVKAIQGDGSRVIYAQPQSAALNFHAGLARSVIHRDGTVQKYDSAEPVQDCLLKALRNPLLAKALRLRDADNFSWSDLYRLYEVIEEGAGGQTAIVRAGWSSRAALQRFTRTANSVNAAGDDARHGVERTQPPAHRLPLPEARAFIDGLLRAWLATASHL